MDELAGRGVRFTRYEGMDQEDAGGVDTDGTRVAWFLDPDGNNLSVSQHPSIV